MPYDEVLESYDLLVQRVSDLTVQGRVLTPLADYGAAVFGYRLYELEGPLGAALAADPAAAASGIRDPAAAMEAVRAAYVARAKAFKGAEPGSRSVVWMKFGRELSGPVTEVKSFGELNARFRAMAGREVCRARHGDLFVIADYGDAASGASALVTMEEKYSNDSDVRDRLESFSEFMARWTIAIGVEPRPPVAGPRPLLRRR
jgi:hypothetical protein